MQFPSNNLTSENINISPLRCHVGYANNQLINKQLKKSATISPGNPKTFTLVLLILIHTLLYGSPSQFIYVKR